VKETIKKYICYFLERNETFEEISNEFILVVLLQISECESVMKWKYYKSMKYKTVQTSTI
jgi:hypothetical protein